MKLIHYIAAISLIFISTGLYLQSNNRPTVKNNNPKTFVIVGSSAAGQGCAYELSKLIKNGSLAPTSRIIWISADKNQPYDRTDLADYISKDEDIFTNKKEHNNITYISNQRVTSIHKDQNTLELNNGQTIAYDKLFLGLGTTPSTLDIPHVKGVFQYFSLDDATAIKNSINKQHQQKAVVLGAGLCALECADVLNKCGVDVTLITKNDHVLNRKISSQDATFIENAMLKSGIHHHRNATVTNIIEEQGKLTHVLLSDGSILPADIFVYAIGGRPNTKLAQDAGLTLHNNGILVDDYMRTSDAAIYAAGDCTTLKDRITGALVNSEKWGDAREQGKIAAHAMAGLAIAPYEGAVIGNIATFFDTRFAISGPLTQPDGHTIAEYTQDGAYYKFLLKEGRLKGYFAFNISRAKVFALRKALIAQEIIDPKDLMNSSFIKDIINIFT